MKKCLIVTGGLVSHSFLEKKLNNHSYEMIIGVDHGNDALRAISCMPQTVVGDLDSVSDETLRWLKSEESIEWLLFNEEKDDTDTAIALDYAKESGFLHVDILGATGSRLDHMFSSILLLEKYIGIINIVVEDAHNQLVLYKAPLDNHIIYKEGFKYFSLVPISEKVTGVTYEGAKYPLKDAVIERMTSLGVSNEFLTDSVIVSVKKGLFLFIKSRD